MLESGGVVGVGDGGEIGDGVGEALVAGCDVGVTVGGDGLGGGSATVHPPATSPASARSPMSPTFIGGGYRIGIAIG